jgi:capsular polysaccharide biosynthesis protein
MTGRYANTLSSRRLHDASEDFQSFAAGEAAKPRLFAHAAEHIVRRSRLVLTCIVCGAALSLLVGLFLMPRYTAKALLITNDSEFGDAARRGDDGVIDTHVALLSSRAHLDRVLAELEKDPALSGRYSQSIDLDRHLKVMQELRSHLISVNFTAKSSETAARVANVVAQLYVDDSLSPDSAATAEAAARQNRRISELEDKYRQALADQRALLAQPSPDISVRADAERRIADLRREIDSERLNQTLAQRQEESHRQALALSPPIRIYALARPPEQPSSARPIMVVVPATIASAMFGVALALLFGRLDRRIHGAADLTEIFSAPLVGAVPPKLPPSAEFETARERAAIYEAAMREMAVNIFLNAKARTKYTVLVTAAHADAREDFAFDLALAASRMKRVLLAVAGDENLAARYAQATDSALRDGERLLCCSLAPDESRLLSLAASGALARTLRELRRSYDWIVVATPPACVSPAARVMARMADAIVLNVAADGVAIDDVAATLREVAPLGESLRDAALRRRVVFALSDAEPSASGDALMQATIEQWRGSLRNGSDVALRLAREKFDQQLPESRQWMRALANPSPQEERQSESADENGKEHIAI